MFVCLSLIDLICLRRGDEIEVEVSGGGDGERTSFGGER